MDDSEDSTGDNEDVETIDCKKPKLSISSVMEPSFAAVEEFQSMGLRPMEFRPEVIRRAMNRSALPLATLHLSHPGGVVERRLSLLVTTGYRLLDPRRREDAIQRMMLGRIHPQLADELVRETQVKGQALLAPDSVDEIGIDFDVKSDLLPRFGQSATSLPRTLKGVFLADDSPSSWSQSLQSQDLLIDRPLRRSIRVMRTWVFASSIPVLAAIGFMVVTAGAWSIFKPTDSSRIAQQKTDDSRIGTRAIASGVSSTRVVVAAEQPTSVAIAGPVSGSMVDDRDLEKSLRSSVVSTLPVAEDTNVSMPASETASTSSENNLVADEQPTSEGPENPLQLPPSNVTAIDPPKPVQSSVIPKMEIEPFAPRPKPEAMVYVEELAGVKTKLPMPSDDELSSAIIELEQSLSKVGSHEWEMRLKKSLELFDASKRASEPFKEFAALRQASICAVLAGDYSAADAAMLEIVKQFDTDLEAIAASVSIEVVKLSRLEAETRHAVLWLGTFTGRSLVDGKLDRAEHFAKLLEQIAASVDDEAAIERSKEFAKTMVSIRRFEATAVALDSEIGRTVSASEHFAAGRYWALVRRDWVKALPHLSACSDARLAALASREILMGGSPDLEELLEVANGYLALAEKSKGWLADSYALHADEILGVPTVANSNAGDLELGRTRSKIAEQFAPAFSLAKRMEFPEDELNSEKTRQLSVGTKPARSRPSDIKTQIPTFAGKLLLQGQDVGVSVRYEPGVVLNRSIYDRIEERAKLSLADASMELAGVIHVERPTAIVIQVSSSKGADEQTVTIDGKALADSETSTSRDSSITIYRADLSTGNWTLRWNVSKLVAGLSLQIVDGLSGSPISLIDSSARDDNENLAPPEVLQVTIATRS